MSLLTAAFLILAVAGALLRLWLLRRQAASVRSNRDAVPPAFSSVISPEDHRRAADFTLAHSRLTAIDIVIGTVLLLALTVGGGVAAIDNAWQQAGWSGLWHGAAVIATVMLVMAIVDLPLSVWRTFRVEARFGFNRTTPRLYVVDLVRSLVLGTALGAPLLLAILALMERAGQYWWLFAFALWAAFMLVMMWAWPSFIAPLFNKFTPLEDPALRTRVEGLLARCGFASRGIFVMDGSRRSSHGNAYFTGIGRNKRIVFFDTLIERLLPAEIEAVLAHELGHFSLHHVRKRLLVSLLSAFAGLAILGQLAAWPGFYAALGVPEPSNHAALLLFILAMPVITFFLTPLGASWSRRHEFEADAFASAHANAGQLVDALVKLYRDNATTLTPDPLYAAFYFSHPPALVRIQRLQQLARATS